MSQKIIDIEPPRTLGDLIRDVWLWRIHKHRIAVGIRQHFDSGLKWDPRPRFPKPITAMLYEKGELVAYRDGKKRWWDFSD